MAMVFMLGGRQVAAVVALGALVGCGPKTSTRMVDDPTGTAVAYGAPRQTRYAAELAANKQRARIQVFQSAVCDVIPVTVMQRYQETLHGDEVVQRAPVTKKQVAGEPKGTVPCDQTYARNAEVLLEISGNQVSLGMTNAEGFVFADLARILEAGAYPTPPQQAKVLARADKGARSTEVGVIELTQLDAQQSRLTQLLAELEAILAKGETGQSSADITKSYELYSQLVDIGGADPRVEGISARFWELLYGRKQEEARERMGRNLEALGAARETLKVMGDAAIPIFVQAAVNSGTLDRQALEWSSLRLISALRGAPASCASFAFSSVPSYGWGAEQRVAAQYVEFGYGTEHAASLQAACRAF
jgi:hypothetical protein